MWGMLSGTCQNPGLKSISRIWIRIHTLLAFIVCVGHVRGQGNKPNIIFINTDDLGWNDVGWNGGNEVISPRIDALAHDGLILQNLYAHFICAPSRAALMTGKYATHVGMDGGNIAETQPYGLPTKYTLIPEELKRADYHTYMVGKWHLGFYHWKYTPHRRGFDQFYGSFLGGINKWSDVKTVSDLKLDGHDLRNNTQRVRRNNTYISYWHFERIQELVTRHATGNDRENEPFFLYFPTQLPHNPDMSPTRVQNRYLSNESIVTGIEEPRLEYLGMLTVIDEVVGMIEDLLKDLDLWDNTLLIFNSDNGADKGESNYPFRGDKGTLWEGGVHTPAFINGGPLNDSRRGTVYDGLIHIVDWLPTFVSLAGLPNTTAKKVDGIDLSELILDSEWETPREELLLNVEWGDYFEKCTTKLRGEEICGGMVYRNSSQIFKLVIGFRVEDKGKGWKPLPYQEDLPDPIIDCGGDPPEDYTHGCPFNGKACLYDLTTDPCEYYDVSEDYPDIYDYMVDRLVKYKKSAKRQLSKKYFFFHEPFLADPNNHGGYWSPWNHYTFWDWLLDHPEYIFLILAIILFIVSCWIGCYFCVRGIDRKCRCYRCGFSCSHWCRKQALKIEKHQITHFQMASQSERLDFGKVELIETEEPVEIEERTSETSTIDDTQTQDTSSPTPPQ